MSYKAGLQTQPLTPKDESEAELFKRWNVPDMTEQPRHAQEIALNMQVGPDVAETRVEDEEEAPALTAEALEAIRQAAYEEGFEQGRQEGAEKGHQEGLDAGLQEGKAQGIEEGRQEGLAQGAAQIEEKTASFAKLMSALYQPQQQIDQMVEHQLVELTSQLAQAVTHHELKTNPAIILNTLKEAVDLLPFQQQRVRVQLNPSDLELIQESFSDDQIAQRGWLLEAEPALAIGDLRLLTERSDITITMQERLEQVTQLFLSQLNKSPEAHNHNMMSDEQMTPVDASTENGDSNESDSE